MKIRTKRRRKNQEQSEVYVIVVKAERGMALEIEVKVERDMALEIEVRVD